MFSLSDYFRLIGINDILHLIVYSVHTNYCDSRTLIMITSVDRNSDGFAVGSRTVEDDWNDWKRPVMSRDSAKLFRNKTFQMHISPGHERIIQLAY